MKEKPANVNKGVFFFSEVEVHCKTWADLDQEKNSA